MLVLLAHVRCPGRLPVHSGCWWCVEGQGAQGGVLVGVYFLSLYLSIYLSIYLFGDEGARGWGCTQLILNTPTPIFISSPSA